MKQTRKGAFQCLSSTMMPLTISSKAQWGLGSGQQNLLLGLLVYTASPCSIRLHASSLRTHGEERKSLYDYALAETYSLNPSARTLVLMITSVFVNIDKQLASTIALEESAPVTHSCCFSIS